MYCLLLRGGSDWNHGYITGDLNFLGVSPTTNTYDPTNGFVPATGYQNSAANQDSPTLTIVGGNEFGFELTNILIVTSFSNTGFTFTDTDSEASNFTISPIKLTLTDNAFQDVTELSSTFTGLTYGIVGDIITTHIPGFSESDGDVFSASFSTTPEPPSFWLLAIGAAGLAGLRKLRGTA
jgi:hypothetical protein